MRVWEHSCGEGFIGEGFIGYRIVPVHFKKHGGLSGKKVQRLLPHTTL